MTAKQVSILKQLDHKCIFSCRLNEDKDLLCFLDGCDEYFQAQLTKSEVIQLIGDFQELADKMVEK